MKFSLLGVRVGILAFKIMVMVIVILSFIPLMTGGIEVQFPEGSETSWTVEGDVLNFNAPMTVTNKGFYDINDFKVGIQLFDADGDLLTETSSVPVDILAGRVNEVNIEMSLDLSTISSGFEEDLVFNGTRLTMRLGVETRYTWDLVGISVGGDMEMQWEPLISEPNIRTDMARIESGPSGNYLIVLFSYRAQDMIVGQEIWLDLTLSNETATLGEAYRDIMIQGNENYEEMYIPISNETMEHLLYNPDHLTVTVEMGYDTAATTESIDWWWNP